MLCVRCCVLGVPSQWVSLLIMLNALQVGAGAMRGVAVSVCVLGAVCQVLSLC